MQDQRHARSLHFKFYRLSLSFCHLLFSTCSSLLFSSALHPSVHFVLLLFLNISCLFFPVPLLPFTVSSLISAREALFFPHEPWNKNWSSFSLHRGRWIHLWAEINQSFVSDPWAFVPFVVNLASESFSCGKTMKEVCVRVCVCDIWGTEDEERKQRQTSRINSFYLLGRYKLCYVVCLLQSRVRYTRFFRAEHNRTWIYGAPLWLILKCLSSYWPHLHSGQFPLTSHHCTAVFQMASCIKHRESEKSLLCHCFRLISNWKDMDSEILQRHQAG